MEFPENVMKKITEISSRTSIEQDEIKREYEELFNDPFLQEDPQFKTDEERHRYAIAVLWTRYISRPPAQLKEIIPIGYSGVRMTRSGVPMSNLFVLVKQGGETKLRRVVLRGDLVDLRQQIALFAKYNVRLGELSSGDLIADSRSKFENPVALKIEPSKVLNHLGFQRVSIKDLDKYPSRVDSTGYVDTTDWRIVRGIIVNQKKGKRDDGTEYGVITLSDETVDSEPRVTPDGRVLRPGLTVWVAPELMIYDVESEVDVAGTVQIGQKTGEPFVNAYTILPVHAKEVK